MRMIDGKTATVAPSYEIERDTIGIVVRNRDDTKENTLGLYIPRFMLGIPLKKKGAVKESVTLDIGGVIQNKENKSIGESSISTQNYIDVPCFLMPNMVMPRYEYGERVKVTMADSDLKSLTFYPFSVQDTKKRKTDIFGDFVPAKKDCKEEISKENSYYREFNSRDKEVILFSTSKKNGEKCTFFGRIDTKKGEMTIRDDKDKKRLFVWDYETDSFKFQTDGESIWELKDKKLTVLCDDYEVKAKKSIYMETDKYTVKANEGLLDIKKMEVKTNTYENKGNKYLSNYPTTEMKGLNWNTTFTQALHTIPNFSVTGVVLAAGMAMGAAPGAAPAPPLSPGVKAAGPSAMTDLAGMGTGQPLAFAAPTVNALNAIAAVADKALGIAMWHQHPIEYFPLCPDPTQSIPVVPKPPAFTMLISTGIVSGLAPTIPDPKVLG